MTERATHPTGPATHIANVARQALWKGATHFKELVFGRSRGSSLLAQEMAYRDSDYTHAPRSVAPRAQLPVVAQPPKPYLPYLNVQQRWHALDVTLYEAIKNTAKMWWRRNPVDRALLSLRTTAQHDVSSQLTQLKWLGAMGPRATAAIPELLRLLKADRNPDICLAVIDTIFAIDPKCREGEALLAILFTKTKEYTVRRGELGSMGTELVDHLLAPAIFRHMQRLEIPVAGILAEIIVKDTESKTRQQALHFLDAWLEKYRDQTQSSEWDAVSAEKIVAALRRRLLVDESLISEDAYHGLQKKYVSDTLTGSYDYNSAAELDQEIKVLNRLLDKWERRQEFATDVGSENYAVAAK